MLNRLSPLAWSAPQAAHLLNRAGFGGTPEEIAGLQRLGLDRAVETLLKGDDDDDLFPPPQMSQPAELMEMRMQMRDAASGDEKQNLIKSRLRQERGQVVDLRTWWLNRMRYTTYPLREKMTLFWHGHFATSIKKTKATYLMWQQNETLRANALGNFRDLTKAVSKDPAMMRYLDTVDSARLKPNENFARELMELFTLGEGVCYTEKDVKESARSFTGYRIMPGTMQYIFRPRQFDDSEKMFMGQKGVFNGDNIIDIILQQRQASEFMIRKLWTFFAYENPSDAVVESLAFSFRNSGYDIKATLREMFLSQEFYSARAVRTQVKSPTQWMIQTARVLEAPLPSQDAMEVAQSQLGQVLFDPPNVKGWDGGRAWISSATLLFRYNMAGYIVSGKAPALSVFRRNAGTVDVPLEKVAPAAVRNSPEKLCDAMAERLFNAPLPADERGRFVTFVRQAGPSASDATVRDLLHLMMSTPEYQLT